MRRLGGEVPGVLKGTEHYRWCFQGESLVLEMLRDPQEEAFRSDPDCRWINKAKRAGGSRCHGLAETQSMVGRKDGAKRSGRAESPSLAEGGTEGQSSLEAKVRLYALGEHGGTSTLCVGGDGRVNGRLIHVGPTIHERDIELDHIRRDEWE